MISAFALIELLLVIAVLAILVALLSPVLSRAKASVRSAQCMSDLHQLQLAWLSYADDDLDLLGGAAGPLPYSGSTIRMKVL